MSLYHSVCCDKCQDIVSMSLCSIPYAVTSVRILSVCHCSIPNVVTSVRILSVCHCCVPYRRHVTKNINYNVDLIT